jgi:hypothetical protein
LEQITPDLTVEGDTVTSGPLTRQAEARPAVRSQVLELIADLLDESSSRQSFLHWMHSWRMDAVDLVSRHFKRDPSLMERFIRPVWELDALRMVRILSQMADAAREPNLQAARAKQPPIPIRGEASLDQAARPFSEKSPRLFEAVFRMQYRSLASRRLAAVALAIRLYRADHRGMWPRSLSDLVPTYLAAVPADPLAGDNRPLSYLRDAPASSFEAGVLSMAGVSGGPFAAGPLIYSVGTDGTDDGGSRRLPTKVRNWSNRLSYSPDEWEDLVLPLSTNPLVPRASGAPR